MKNTKPRFTERLAKFSASLDDRLTLNGQFRGRMILKELRSTVEFTARDETWSLGKTNDGYWIILQNREKESLATWIVPPGRSLESMEVIIPLPYDLRARFEHVIKQKTLAASLKAALHSEPVMLNLSPGCGKTVAYLNAIRLLARLRREEPPPQAPVYVDQFTGPRVYTVWRP